MKGTLKEGSRGQTASKTFDYGQTTSFPSLLEQNGTHNQIQQSRRKTSPQVG